MAGALRLGVVRLAMLVGLPFGAACAAPPATSAGAPAADRSGVPGPAEDVWAARRRTMVNRQIEGRGIRDPEVLRAVRAVPRHRFVPAELQESAYDDSPLPIGFGQTISQPYIVAYMSEILQIEPQHTVLEIGTGSGYQAAVLGELAREVYTVEIVPELGQRARTTLESLGYRNIHVRIGDGYEGWAEHAPFDRIMVTAAPDHVPQPLVQQLAVGGRLVLPVGRGDQWIRVLTKTPDRVIDETTIPVRFVPLVRKPGGPGWE
jgi:protein-L-isoaspartate(D-aspartate) O-methyltransferase